MSLASISRSLWQQSTDLNTFGLLPASQPSIFRSSQRDRALDACILPVAEDVPPSFVSLLLAKTEASEAEFQGSKIGVVLSNRYCRFLTLPWSDALLSEVDGAAYMLRAFADAYGDNASQWEICCPDEAYGRPRVACAIDREILSSVRVTCAEHKRELAFVRPYFSAAYNRFREQMPVANGVLAVVENEVLTIGRWVNGSVVEIEVLPCTSDWQSVLMASVARSRLEEEALGEVFVVCPPGWMGDAVADDKAGWKLLTWPEEVAACVAEHPALALPACAI
jgi:hypothetical protein